MTAIDNIINQIEGETQNRGNTKTRIAAVLRLLRDKIERLFSTKLDKGNYTGTADDLRTSIDRKVDKVPGKMLSTNDFTNELRTKLEGLRNVDISQILPRGGYTGTAQNLKELIDNIMRILQSPDTELDELREIVAFIKQNKRILDTLGISNIAGLQDALNGKAPTDHHHDDRYSRLGHTHTEYALRTHRHRWDDIDGKPSLNFAPLHHRHNWSDIDEKPDFSKILIDRRGERTLESNEINVFKPLLMGTYRVNRVGEGGLLVVLKTDSSASSIELWAPSYQSHRLHYNWSVDNNRYGSVFKELAYYEDVYRVGGEISSNWTAVEQWQNGVIFVSTSLNINLSNLKNKGNMSFRKVFAGGGVTFSCTGKTIIYTGDNAFNGGDGSTAVVSIWNQKCYIDIRNV
jgi:hypothetical protein